MYKCNVVMFLFSLIALPQDKAETEDPGIKNKDPCTFQSAKTLQNTHTHTYTYTYTEALTDWRCEGYHSHEETRTDQTK